MLRESILRAIRIGCEAFPDVVIACNGADPSEVRNELKKLIESGQIVEKRMGRFRLAETSRQLKVERTNSLPDLQLPHPHPLDYDWRFTPESSTQLCERIIEECSIDTLLLLLGSPSIWLSMQQFAEMPRTILIDHNDEIASILNYHYSQSNFWAVVHNLLESKPFGEKDIARIVLCDPPWYFEHYLGFLRQASYSACIDGEVLLSLLPINTRPSAAQDRWKILEFAHEQGLELESLQCGAISYQSPPFELSSFQTMDINISRQWRKADLAVLRKTRGPRRTTKARSTEIPSTPEWETVVLGRKTIKVRGPFNDHQAKPKILTIEKNNILPTVSRRYKRRKLIDLWLWDNRVFKLRGRSAFRAALLIRAGKATLVDFEWLSEKTLSEVEEQLDRIIGPSSVLATIAQTLNYFARGNNSTDVTHLEQICRQNNLTGHIAIMTQPYLDQIMSGEKTIESRFSQNRIAPYNQIDSDDVLFLKESGGPIRAIVSVRSISFSGPLQQGEAEALIETHQNELQVKSDFKREKKSSRYATLIYVGDVLPILPIHMTKSDRRSWIVLNDQTQPELL